MTKKFYVTTPIYYVNDIPHLGHVYTTLAADYLARYHRMKGQEVFFLTGTDEHGQKASRAAQDKGQDVQAHVDYHAGVFSSLWEKMNISNDDFIRTTEERHAKVVRAVLQELYDRGEIYADTYEGWYCVPDERFWTEKDLVDGNCPECGRKVEKIQEKNYFFRMGKRRDWLKKHIEENDDFILPRTRRNEVLGFLEKDLGDLCISRPKARMDWGIELPFDGEYVTYVWFDALLNYATAPGYLQDDEKFNGIWPADIHLIGKDILTTHSVYWITMLEAIGIPLPKKIFAHGWWTVEGRKMSKSFGNAIEPTRVADAVGLDPFRYFLMKEVPFGLDGDFNLEALFSRINVDLANNFGNLVSRSVKMINKFRGGTVPEPKNGPELQKLINTAEKHMARYDEQMEIPAFNRALDETIELCDAANVFITEMQPWELAKDDGKADQLNDVLYGLAECLRILGRMLYPVMPDTGATLLAALGLKPEDCGQDSWGCLKPGATVEEVKALFPRLDEKKMKKIAQQIFPEGLKTGKAEEKPEQGGAGLITIDDFKKVDLRTGVIKEAEAVKKSKKLIKVMVDLGGETRQILAGIAEHYAPEDLPGRRVIVVANLKPAKLMGIESQGMLLAADDNGKLSLITTSNEIDGGKKVS